MYVILGRVHDWKRLKWVKISRTIDVFCQIFINIHDYICRNIDGCKSVVRSQLLIECLQDPAACWLWLLWPWVVIESFNSLLYLSLSLSLYLSHFLSSCLSFFLFSFSIYFSPSFYRKRTNFCWGLIFVDKHPHKSLTHEICTHVELATVIMAGYSYLRKLIPTRI